MCTCTSGRRTAFQACRPDKIRHSPRAFFNTSKAKPPPPPCLCCRGRLQASPRRTGPVRRDGCCGTPARCPLRHFQLILRRNDRPPCHPDRIAARYQVVQAKIDGILTQDSPHHRPRIRINRAGSWPAGRCSWLSPSGPSGRTPVGARCRWLDHRAQGRHSFGPLESEGCFCFGWSGSTPWVENPHRGSFAVLVGLEVTLKLS